VAATAAEIAQVRRMAAEPTTATYSDTTIKGYIETYPLIDVYGYEPADADGIANPDWTPTYDLNAAAADIWDEKASALAAQFDFNADGANFQRSQTYKQAAERGRYYRSRRSPRTLVLMPQVEADVEDEPGQRL